MFFLCDMTDSMFMHVYIYIYTNSCVCACVYLLAPTYQGPLRCLQRPDPRTAEKPLSGWRRTVAFPTSKYQTQTIWRKKIDRKNQVLQSWGFRTCGGDRSPMEISFADGSEQWVLDTKVDRIAWPTRGSWKANNPPLQQKRDRIIFCLALHSSATWK